MVSDFWQVFWLVFEVFFFLAYLILLFRIVGDLIRDTSLSGLAMAAWIFGLIVFPLITALAYNPFAVGLGLDEDTAAFIGPDETLEVEGSGGVTVVDASKVSFSSVDSVTEGQPICILGLVVHVLTAGASFNLHTRQAAATALIQPRD